MLDLWQNEIITTVPNSKEVTVWLENFDVFRDPPSCLCLPRIDDMHVTESQASEAIVGGMVKPQILTIAVWLGYYRHQIATRKIPPK